MTPCHTQPIGPFTGAFRFLSNFFPSPVEFEGLTYATVEHAFQAAKTVNPVERERIQRCSTPGAAKRLGRKLTLRPGWDLIKLEVMENLVRQKFTQHLGLRELLLRTDSRPLVEQNTWGDRFWGLYHGVGENHLGRILMKVRAELLKGEAQ